MRPAETVLAAAAAARARRENFILMIDEVKVWGFVWKEKEMERTEALRVFKRE